MPDPLPPETPPAAPPETPPAAPPAEPDELAGLSPEARRLVERANNEAGARRKELQEARQALEDLQRRHETEQQRAIREAEERGRSAGRTERDDEVAGVRRESATFAIKARAADRFADPDDAVRLLPLDELLGEPDAAKRDAAVDRALDELLTAKPYLGREQRPPQPLVSQGGRSDAPNGRPRERSWLRG